jgi:hypothetical protein
MTHKALLRQLQISCLGLDPVDPLRLLVDDVVAALAQPDQDHIPDARKMVTEQEPVVGITAIRTWFKDGRVVTQTLCNSWVDTTPPQRTWVGLTDEEIDTWNIVGHESLREFVRAIEAKLKDKNDVAQETNS